MQPVQGLHHITAVAGDPQKNVDFYHHVLGQRLVKTTVNFDDPGTYHFYFGDEIGSPGTILTFFPWRNIVQGLAGNGEAAAVAYAIAPAAVPFWRRRLVGLGVTVGEPSTRFGAEVVTFHDPDGMRLELVVDDAPASFRYWAAGPIPEPYALRGFHSVTLWLDDLAATAALLTGPLGHTLVGEEGSRSRYAGAGDDMGRYVDLLQRPGGARGRFGAGSIHHIAFRTVGDEEQHAYQSVLRQAGQQVTPVQDRQYFRSIYFRSPGGVLFEIATDAPGFASDEPVAALGSQLKLPSWLEPQREKISALLPPFERKPIVRAEVVNE